MTNWLRNLGAHLTGTVRGHWQFSVVLLAAMLLRVVVILGYPPVMWFDDSFNYFQDAVTQVPDQVRPNGYPFFLSLLLPLHSMYPVAIAQAAMGAGMGVLIYAVLRRRGLPWWGATLPAVPVLFDVFELQLEHLVAADVLFIFLITLALVMCCWNDRPSVPTLAVAGLLIGYATIVRSVGEPLLVVVIIGMLARKAGWRRLTALTVAGIVPIVSYLAWFDYTTGKFALTESSGTFLYSRVMTFAECAKIKPPPDLAVLCDPTPTWARWPAAQYVWQDTEWKRPYQNRQTPLVDLLQSDNTGRRFTSHVNKLARQFAEQAIIAQPVAYLRVVTHDTLHTFGWTRQPDPDGKLANGNGPHFRFSGTPGYRPGWTTAGPAWGEDATAVALNAALVNYLGPGAAQPSASKPWAGFVQWYQSWAYFRGTLLGLVVLTGAGGVALGWRRWGGLSLLPWLTGVLLIVLPPMTAGFSYRYVVAAVPAACLAAGLAFASPRSRVEPVAGQAGGQCGESPDGRRVGAAQSALGGAPADNVE